METMINGFKIIEDYGYTKTKHSRRALIECKVCKRHYEADPNKLQYRKHCGCVKKGQIVNKYCKSHPRLVDIYHKMKKRCYTKNNKDYYNYGALGIKICKEWLDDSNKFCEWAIINGYNDNLTIDRINNKKGYSPENCKWSDAKEQGRNTRRNVLNMEKALKMRSESNMTRMELAVKYKVSKSTVWLVLNNRIWIP